MTKAKKVLSLVLAVVMVAAMFAFSASAATQNATFTVSVDNATVSQGDVINVTVNLTTDYYAGPTNVPVYYNPAVFEFVADSVTGTKIFGATATDVQSYNDAVTGCLKVAFIPNTADGTAAAKLMNGTLFTFQLRAIADGTSDIGLKAEDQKTSTNIGGTLYCGAYTSSAIDNNPATVGQTFAITNTSATVGATATPELQLSAYGAEMGAVIDKVSTCNDGDGFVYGIATHEGETISDYLTTPAGSIQVVANDQGNESTGALIQLLDDGGNVVETYIFVLFGDVNGDGAIDSTDVTDIESVAMYLNDEYYADDGTAWSIAADTNGDSSIDSTDVTDVEGVAMYTVFTTQADFAAAVASGKGI